MSSEVNTSQIVKDDIIQICHKAAKSRCFAGLLMIVDEVKTWGVQCYCFHMSGGEIYYRATWDEILLTGGKARLVSCTMVDA